MAAEQFNHILDMEAAAGTPVQGGAPAGQPASSGNDASTTASSTRTTTSSDNAPLKIILNGNNPATVQVGVSYADLGARIVSPSADTNLGITTLLDGATTTGQVSLDTTTAGSHTILYTVTDPKGLTGSATRTVIIAAPANDNPPPLAPTGTSTASSTNP